MKFSIAFDDSPQSSQDDSLLLGSLALNDDKEWFKSSLSFWSKTQYQEHWKQAITRLRNGQEKSALITNMLNPQTANFLIWWPLWNNQGQVHIQNHLLFLAELDCPFDVSRFYDFVGERETHSDDGLLLSEWKINLDDLLGFLLSIEQ